MMNTKKITTLFLCLFLFSQLIYAQDGIDTALFKQLGVKKMWVYVKLPILPKKSLKDSCKVEDYEMGKLGNILYENQAVSCYGWTGSSEKIHTYSASNHLVLTKSITEGHTTFIKFSYNIKSDIVKIVQNSPNEPDSMVTSIKISYNKKGLKIEERTRDVFKSDSNITITKYEYDAADNLKLMSVYTGEMQLIQRKTYEFSPKSRKLLEFSTETKLPSQSFTRGWNLYNFDARVSKTEFSNNTWTEYLYFDNGLLDQTLSYNMEGKLNSWKTYYYSYFDGNK